MPTLTILLCLLFIIDYLGSWFAFQISEIKTKERSRVWGSVRQTSCRPLPRVRTSELLRGWQVRPVKYLVQVWYICSDICHYYHQDDSLSSSLACLLACLLPLSDPEPEPDPNLLIPPPWAGYHVVRFCFLPYRQQIRLFFLVLHNNYRCHCFLPLGHVAIDICGWQDEWEYLCVCVSKSDCDRYVVW